MTHRNPRVFPTPTSKLQLSLIEIHKTRSILASTSWERREERATMSLESAPETISIIFWRRRKCRSATRWRIVCSDSPKQKFPTAKMYSIATNCFSSGIKAKTPPRDSSPYSNQTPNPRTSSNRNLSKDGKQSLFNAWRNATGEFSEKTTRYTSEEARHQIP